MKTEILTKPVTVGVTIRPDTDEAKALMALLGATNLDNGTVCASDLEYCTEKRGIKPVDVAKMADQLFAALDGHGL